MVGFMNRISILLSIAALMYLAYAIWDYFTPIYAMKLNCTHTFSILEKPAYMSAEAWVDTVEYYFPECGITLFRDGKIIPHE